MNKTWTKPDCVGWAVAMGLIVYVSYSDTIAAYVVRESVGICIETLSGGTGYGLR